MTFPTWVQTEKGKPVLVECGRQGLAVTPLGIRDVREDRLELADLQFRLDVDEMARLRSCGCARCQRRAVALDRQYP